MDKRIIIKLIANEFTEKTINYKIPDDDAKYDNSLRESFRENSFLVDYEERLDPKEQYEYNVDSKNINKLINIKELNDDIITHAREFARKNNTNIVNAYVYFDDILLFAYLIRFKANEYPEINWDNPQVMRCNGEEYIKLDYRNTKSFTNKHARLDFKKEESTNGEVYKIINIDRFDKLKENNKTNLIYISKIQPMNINNWNRKKFDSGIEQNKIQDTKNVRAINTNNNYTYINNKSFKKSNGYVGREYPPGFFEGLYANAQML